MNYLEELEHKGLCPICDRPMYAGASVDKHHFFPKCKGGKETELCHKVCHQKIHSLFTESELAREYSDPELVRAHPEIQKFVKWLARKDPLFYDHHKDHTDRKKKRRGH